MATGPIALLLPVVFLAAAAVAQINVTIDVNITDFFPPLTEESQVMKETVSREAGMRGKRRSRRGNLGIRRRSLIPFA
jgi:hypothetical protein